MLLPAALRADTLHIVPALHDAVLAEDSGLLLAGAARLVALNTVRAAPLYLGALLLGQGLREWARARRSDEPRSPIDPARLTERLAYFLAVLAIPASYFLIARLHGIAYDFGVPAYLAIVAIFLLHRLARQTQGLGAQIVILAAALFAVQWLDVVTFLSAFGFGRGDLSAEIKNAAAFLHAEPVLDGWSAFLSASFGTFALFLAGWTVGAAKHLGLVEQLHAERLEGHRRQMLALEDRATRELQFLVHDLKTPLVTVQGLVSLARLRLGGLDGEEAQHLLHVENSLDRLGTRISELLKEDVRHPVSAEQLVSYVRRQLAVSAPGEIRWAVVEDVPAVEVNLPRLARAVVNLVLNAHQAAARAGQEPFVIIRIRPLRQGRGRGQERRRERKRERPQERRPDARQDTHSGTRLEMQPGMRPSTLPGLRSGIRLTVRDKGPGIPRWALRRVIEPGFSLSGGSGLGLTFVRQVVEEVHGGVFRIYSHEGLGTLAVIELPVATEGE